MCSDHADSRGGSYEWLVSGHILKLELILYANRLTREKDEMMKTVVRPTCIMT